MQLDDVEDGAATARIALTGLPDGYCSGLIAARAADVDHVIPAAARRRPEVLEFRALLTPANEQIAEQRVRY